MNTNDSAMTAVLQTRTAGVWREYAITGWETVTTNDGERITRPMLQLLREWVTPPPNVIIEREYTLDEIKQEQPQYAGFYEWLLGSERF